VPRRKWNQKRWRLRLVGTNPLAGGIAIFATAGRTDEPPLKDAVK
jgi:hypothetical protein